MGLRSAAARGRGGGTDDGAGGGDLGGDETCERAAGGGGEHGACGWRGEGEGELRLQLYTTADDGGHVFPQIPRVAPSFATEAA